MSLRGTVDPTVYRGLRDVLKRRPAVVSVRYRPDRISKRFLRAEIAPSRLSVPTGDDPPRLDVEWRFAGTEPYYRIHYADPGVGFHCGWHRDDDHPELGPVHFQYAFDDGDRGYESASFDDRLPSEILWTATDRLFDRRLPALLGD
ncbi:MAG: hypothetical protein ABEI75_03965 [Halobaculum sp.]